MGKYKKGYKIVRKHSLNSAVVESDSTKIKYRVGEWAMPKKDCGPLCVFDELEDVHNFIGFWGSYYSIYECLYEPTSVNTV